MSNAAVTDANEEDRELVADIGILAKDARELRKVHALSSNPNKKDDGRIMMRALQTGCYEESLALHSCSASFTSLYYETESYESCFSCPNYARELSGIVYDCSYIEVEIFYGWIDSCAPARCAPSCFGAVQAAATCYKEVACLGASSVAAVTPASSPPENSMCYAEGISLATCLVSAGVADNEELKACLYCPNFISSCSTSAIDNFFSSTESCGIDKCHVTCHDDLQATAECFIKEMCLDTSVGATLFPASSPPEVGIPPDVAVTDSPQSSPTGMENPTDVAATNAPTPGSSNIVATGGGFTDGTDVSDTISPAPSPGNDAVRGGGFTNDFPLFAFVSVASLIYAIGIM